MAGHSTPDPQVLVIGAGVAGLAITAVYWLDLDDIRAEDIVFQTVRQLVSDLGDQAGLTFRREQAKEFLRSNRDVAQQLESEIRGTVATIAVPVEGISEAE